MPELLDDTRFAATESMSAGAPPAPVPGRVSERARRAARGDLRRQIGALEHELAELFASAFPRKGVGFSVPGGGGPRVLDVGELESIRDALAARVHDVRSWLSDRGYAEERNREFLEELIAQPERFPWVRVSNEDIGEPGCRHWHSRPRWGLLGMLMGWWRVKLSSGCPLATSQPRPCPASPWPRSASGDGARVQPRRRRPTAPRAALRRSEPRRRGVAPRGRLAGARRMGRRRRPGARFRSSSWSSSWGSWCSSWASSRAGARAPS